MAWGLGPVVVASGSHFGLQGCFGLRVCLLGSLAVWSIVSCRTQQLNLRGRRKGRVLLRGVRRWAAANSLPGPCLLLLLLEVAHVLARGSGGGSGGG